MTRFFYSLHRILGTLLSALMLMWFVTGIVMMYHTFPSVRQATPAILSGWNDSLPSLEAVIGNLPEGTKVKGLSLFHRLDQPVFLVQTEEGEWMIPADSAATLLPMDSTFFYHQAIRWGGARIARVDTLMDLDQWIPFGRLKEELPIYKFYFDDQAGTQLYLSSKRGEPLQLTTSADRFWAWVGAIPHWVYPTRLRQDVDLWKRTVIILSALGGIMTLAGLYTGVHATVQALRRRKSKQHSALSPYRKRWFYWHHVTGLFFGLFVLTWVFSGMMSLAETPDWIAKEHRHYEPREIVAAGTLPYTDFPLDYRTALAEYGDSVQELRWSYFHGKPLYELKKGETSLTLDASRSEAQELNLRAEEVVAALKEVHADEQVEAPEWMENYDGYYVDVKHRQPLPVWKVRVDNEDHTCYYVQPHSGQFRPVNTKSRWQFWMYRGLHGLQFLWLVEHPLVWFILMWLLLLGGTFVSLTGLVLGVRYLLRKCKS